jgi:hypothetical protein
MKELWDESMKAMVNTQNPLFENNKKDSLYHSLIFFLNNNKAQYKQLVIAKKNSLKYTMFRHYLGLVEILTL